MYTIICIVLYTFYIFHLYKTAYLQMISLNSYIFNICSHLPNINILIEY